MSGHSRWSKVKNFKGKIDATRSRAFSRCSKEISVAARSGGGDPNFNPRLRTAIIIAKSENMPNDNIDRAIKRGTGEIEGLSYEELTYEGYGPGGVALLVEALTDNKNRAAAEIRAIFTRHGGHLATPGAVAYLFHRKGQILIPQSQITEDELMGVVLDAGAEDLRSDEESHEVLTPVEQFDAVLEAVHKRKLEPVSARLTFLPQTLAEIHDEGMARKALGIIEALDEHEDVQHVHSNFDIPDSILEKLQS